MSDGRQFTSYLPNCALDQMIQTKYKITNSQEYRMFLQSNSELIMKDLAKCNSEQTEDCHLCPVCQKALDYKPSAPQ